MAWIAFDSGRSLGTTGSEGGVIRRDEENDARSRITLGEGGGIAPWSITCGIYGWMFHTRFSESEADGSRAFEQMRIGLEGILAIIAREADDVPGSNAEASSAIAAFVNEFP